MQAEGVTIRRLPPVGLVPTASVHLARRARAVSMQAGLLARSLPRKPPEPPAPPSHRKRGNGMGADTGCLQLRGQLRHCTAFPFQPFLAKGPATVICLQT